MKKMFYMILFVVGAFFIGGCDVANTDNGGGSVNDPDNIFVPSENGNDDVDEDDIINDYLDGFVANKESCYINAMNDVKVYNGETQQWGGSITHDCPSEPIVTNDFRLNAGVQTVSIYFPGDEDYNPSSDTATFEIAKAPANLSCSSLLFTTGTLVDGYGVFPSNYTKPICTSDAPITSYFYSGNIYDTYDSGTESSWANVGSFTTGLGDVEYPGYYTFTVSAGGDNYIEEEVTTTFAYLKGNTALTAPDVVEEHAQVCYFYDTYMVSTNSDGDITLSAVEGQVNEGYVERSEIGTTIIYISVEETLYWRPKSTTANLTVE